ncbi:uncharacterized protein [Dermacentor albipictus]|uniref:uncharacterized protein isoform X2 n=1 Tax=Dermacentor albipictus TaxID=60249 RepID=UPI0038FCEE23
MDSDDTSTMLSEYDLGSEVGTGDSDLDDDGDRSDETGTYGRVVPSGGSSSGGATKSIPREPRPTAVRSAPRQPPVGQRDSETNHRRSPTVPPAPHIPGVQPSPSLRTPKTTLVPQPQLPFTPMVTRPPPLQPLTPNRGAPTPQTTKAKVTRPLRPSTPKATRVAPAPQTTKPKIAPPQPSTPKVTQGAPTPQATKPKIVPPPPQKASTPKATRKPPTPQTTKTKVTRPLRPSTPKATRVAPTPQTTKPKTTPPPHLSTPKVTQGAPTPPATKPKITPPPPQKASTPKATRKAPTPQTTTAKVTRPLRPSTPKATRVAPTPQTTKQKTAPPPHLSTPKVTQRAPTPPATKPKITPPPPQKASTPKATRKAPTPQTTKAKVTRTSRPSTSKATRVAPTPQTTKPKTAPPPHLSTPKVTQGAPTPQATKPMIAPPPPQKASTPKATRKAPTPQTTQAKVTRPPPLRPSTQKATPTAPRPKTTKPSTTRPPPGPTQEPTNFTSRQKPRKLEHPLVCTTSSEAYIEAVADLPADGICTFIFYESVYKNGDHPFVNKTPTPGPVPFDIDLGHFARRQFLFIEILLGISFALDKGHLLREYQTPEFRRNLDYTWKEKMYQYGVANMRPPHITRNDIKDALTVIKSLDEYWQKKANFSVIQPSTVLGMPLPENQWPELLDLFKTVFTPHIFIAISHLSISDHTLPECRIMPTSIYNFPANVTARYFQSVNDSGRLLQMMWDKGIRSTLSLSFTMRARWYRPSQLDPNVAAIGNFGLFNPCVDPGVPPDISPGKACNVSATIRNNSRYDPNYFVRIGYDKKLGRTLVFDTVTGMKAKVCTAKQTFFRVNFTVAAYEVEYDVWRYSRFKGSTKCYQFNINGTNERTQFLNKIRTFLNPFYIAAPDAKECITRW